MASTRKPARGKLRQMIRAVQLESAADARRRSSISICAGAVRRQHRGRARGRRCSTSARSRGGCRIAEAALLVALPQSPNARRPDRHAAAAQTRARPRAHATPPRSASSRPTTAARACASPCRPNAATPPQLAAASVRQRIASACPASIVHRTTLDVRMQAALEALARDHAQALGTRSVGRARRRRSCHAARCSRTSVRPAFSTRAGMAPSTWRARCARRGRP